MKEAVGSGEPRHFEHGDSQEQLAALVVLTWGHAAAPISKFWDREILGILTWQRNPAVVLATYIPDEGLAEASEIKLSRLSLYVSSTGFDFKLSPCMAGRRIFTTSIRPDLLRVCGLTYKIG